MLYEYRKIPRISLMLIDILGEFWEAYIRAEIKVEGLHAEGTSFQ